jgi:hypothetical protein
MPLLDPIKNFLNNNYENLNERDSLLHDIINECEDFLPHFLKIRDTKMVRESIHNKICDLEKNDPRFDSLLKQYKLSLQNETEAKKNGDVQYMKFKIALLQKKYILDSIDKDIKKFIKKKSFLVLKSSTLGFYINIIQISIIFVSTLITFFESIKSFITVNEFGLTIIPIIASTYIALSLAISRFFKLDIKKEHLSKVIEKYTFIISRLKSKERLIKNFDFKSRKLMDWHKIIENYNKDGIEDFITKTTEESDTIITLKENVYYQNLYFKLKLEKSLQHFNQDRLPDRDNKFYISKIGNLNEYKVRRCQCYCLKFMSNCCCKTSIDYKKIYDILNNKEIDTIRNSEIKIKQSRRKRYLCNEIENENKNLHIKKKNILTTFSLINNNDNIDLTYEDFNHIIKQDDHLFNSKSINNEESSKEVENRTHLGQDVKNIENSNENKNDTIHINEDLVISIDKETVLDETNSENNEEN